MRRLALLLIGASSLAGALPPPAAARPEPGFAAAARLVDQNGRQIDEGTFAGRVRLAAFGYTHCPDICPTTLATVTMALDGLPAETAARIVPVFVAVDPARDTPAVVRAYLDAFHPRFVGVTGPVAAIDDLAWSYGAVVIRHPDEGGGTYRVDHTADLYLIGPGGRVLARLPHDISPEALADRLGTIASALPDQAATGR